MKSSTYGGSTATREPLLGGVRPSHQISGKAVRFDVHVLRALPQA